MLTQPRDLNHNYEWNTPELSLADWLDRADVRAAFERMNARGIRKREFPFVSDWNTTGLKIEAELLDQEPYKTIYEAQGDCNYNYYFLHPSGLLQHLSPELAASYAEQTDTPLGWDGALQLYSIYEENYAKTTPLRFKTAPIDFADVINKIYATLPGGTDKDLVWCFYQAFYWQCQHRGQINLIDPNAVPELPSVIPNWAKWAVGGLVLAYALPFIAPLFSGLRSRQTTINRERANRASTL